MPLPPLPILAAIPLLPAAFAAGWFGVGAVIGDPVPLAPPEPAFVDIGNIHVRMGNTGLPVAYRTGVTLDPAIIGTPSLAWLRDQSMQLIARAAEMPIVYGIPDAGPQVITEAVASYAPDWLLHMKMLPSDEPVLTGIRPADGEDEPAAAKPASPAELMKG